MLNNNSDEINAVIDSCQKITAFGGFWWLKKFMERLGVGKVFEQDFGIKNRRSGVARSGVRSCFLNSSS
jgi:hypothetical protein